jgi:hypothetical protein
MNQGSDAAILGGSKPYFFRPYFVNYQTGQEEHMCKTKTRDGVPDSLLIPSPSWTK